LDIRNERGVVLAEGLQRATNLDKVIPDHSQRERIFFDL
jgi:hypothetical protein